LLQRVQEIANSYVDQQQELKERRDVIDREERRLEKHKAEKARTESACHAVAGRQAVPVLANAPLSINNQCRW